MAKRTGLMAVLMLVMSGFSSLALAHGGGLNKDGCHNNRKTGDYHCHRAPALAPSSQSALKAQPSASVDNTCYTGPRGGRYRIINGRKRYGC
jgi:hypothetical protein